MSIADKVSKKKKQQVAQKQPVVENFSLTSENISFDEFQPISGLTLEFETSNSKSHFFVFLLPDCMAVLAGLYILAFFIL